MIYKLGLGDGVSGLKREMDTTIIIYLTIVPVSLTTCTKQFTHPPLEKERLQVESVSNKYRI